ncbi:MAG: DMT family transporter [Fervidicoccaceae archaeon]
MKQREVGKTTALLFIAWLSISSASVLVLLSGVTAFHAAFWRLFISSAIIALYSIVIERNNPFSFSLFSLLSGAFLGLHFLLWMTSLFLIPVSLSTTIVVTYPAVIAVMERVFLRELLRLREIIGMLIAFSGIVIMMDPFLSPFNFQLIEGSLLSGTASVMAAGYFFLGRIARKKNVSLSSYTVPTYLFASATVFIIGKMYGISFFSVGEKSWEYLLLLAIIPMIGGHTVMNYLLKMEKASIVSSIALGEPVGATILSYFIVNQNITYPIAAGMFVAIVGMAFLLTSRAKE